MAYTTRFKNDIFISYAHRNNKGFSEGWVAQFHSSLEKALEQYIRDPSIWYDNQKLQGNTRFDLEIEQALNNSALLVVIYSHLHKQSTNCQKEIRHFAEKAKSDGWPAGANNDSRIFNVLINCIPDNEWDPELQGANCYNFFTKDENAPSLGRPIPPNENDFNIRLKKLAEEIFKTLKAFNDSIISPSLLPINNNEAKKKHTVFLAYASDSIRPTIRRQLITEMQAKNIEVIHRIPPPNERELHDKKAIEEISRSHLCIHLFDSLPGREIDDFPDDYYTHRQVLLGKKHAKRQWIWVAPSLKYEQIDHEPHRNLLQELEYEKRNTSNFNFIREPLTVDAIIREAITYLEERNSPTGLGITNKVIVIDSHMESLTQAVRALDPYLRSWQYRPDIHYGNNQDIEENIEILAQKLTSASRLIMVFDTWERELIEFRFQELMKICIAKKKIPSCAIYFAGSRALNEETKFDFGPGLPVCQFSDSDLEKSLTEWLQDK